MREDVQMTEKLEAWIAELNELTDEEGGLRQLQLREVIKQLVGQVHIDVSCQELKFDLLTDLLTQVAYASEIGFLWNRHPVIVIFQDDEGDFQARIFSDPDDGENTKRIPVKTITHSTPGGGYRWESSFG